MSADDLELDALRQRVATLEHELATQRSTQSALHYAEDLIQTLHEPLIVLDVDLRVRLVNRAFYDTFRRSPSQILGKRLFEVGGGQWAVPRLRRLLEEILQDDTSLDDFEVRVTFAALGPRVLLLNARRIERRDEGATTILLAIQDITSRHRVELDLTEAALCDKLTGLYNRRGFNLLAPPLLANLRRAREPVQLLFADVDRLKRINDLHGHAAGDRAIVATAEALRTTFRDSDLVARYGGDEFLVLLGGGDPDPEAPRARLLEAVAAAPPVAGELPLRVSVGLVSVDPDAQRTLEDLITLADRAMYEEKRRRRARRRARGTGRTADGERASGDGGQSVSSKGATAGGAS